MKAMGVPARLSARLCASSKFNGGLAFDLLDIPAGHLKGRTGFSRENLMARRPPPATDAATCPRLPAPRPDKAKA